MQCWECRFSLMKMDIKDMALSILKLKKPLKLLLIK